ncbi:MAG TPA: hypothetical protein VNS58_19435 [Puia sp.]|nr:hypothetical protein [Puia sp.]
MRGKISIGGDDSARLGRKPGGGLRLPGLALGRKPGGDFLQPWIGRPWIEIAFILLPPFLSLAFIAAFPALFREDDSIPDAGWVILILLIDVAHVYSTLYRTYLDPQLRHTFRRPLLFIPLIGFIAGVLLYWQGALLFWRLLAYLAVFHFIRQQYGFLRIYSRQEKNPAWVRWTDTFTIYYATIYPLLYWHLGEPRNFNWFVDDDFFRFRSGGLLDIATLLYYGMLGLYVVREGWSAYRNRAINIPRVAILTGTIVSWYFGIVWFNGDMAFTLLNVVSHGIPYMALIWLYGERQWGGSRLEAGVTGGDKAGALRNAGATGEVMAGGGTQGLFLRKVFSRYGIVLFLGIIFLLAYLEEGLWDMTVWKEHVSLFSAFHLVGRRLHGNWLVVVVPLLALPQVTHYIIDGFIWRRKSS